ncbi:tubby-like F-box protein [Musa troglodytarum]|uniref:Tubby-like F-box protein n=1 Tax=Musa troglodytarum TaxID=320322 RepID=A0A9E7HCW5_9LILI|nr:tubby-like F-box protein [Musa troglodytarum]
MPLKSLVRELKEMTDGIGGGGEGEGEGEGEGAPEPQQGRWVNLPPELLFDVIRRVEASEVSWPARRHVLACAAVCRWWRGITKEVVDSPEQCGRITFPLSLKQPGPRDHPIQCFVRRERTTSTFRLYLGLTPCKRFPRIAPLLHRCLSNFLGTKFMVSDSQCPHDAPVSSSSIRSNPRTPTRHPAGNYDVATISYEFNVLRTRGPRRMQCTMHSIPASSVREAGGVAVPTGSLRSVDERQPLWGSPAAEDKESARGFPSDGPTGSARTTGQPLILKNKSPGWHEQLQCWCLDFKGRVTVASVKNFQLAAAGDPSFGVSLAEQQEKVILQFGKIGKDIFTMDYRYPLSAFQAFAICLTTFDTKPACE